MKKSIILFAILANSSVFFAKNSESKIVLEAAGGYAIPTFAHSNFEQTTLKSFSHSKFAATYFMNPKLGFKLSYSSDNFKNQKAATLGSNMSKIGLEVVKDVWAGKSKGDKMSLFVQAGLGYSRLQPIQGGVKVRIGAISLGISPMYKLSSKFGVFANYTFNLNTYQHYYFNGVLANAEGLERVNAHSNLSIGLAFFIGKTKPGYHKSSLF